MRKALLLILAVLLAESALAAGDLTLSLEQKEYYFRTGENAIIPLEMDNSYGDTIQGMLSYTITQSANQGGFQYSSSNTHSTTFSAPAGMSSASLNFGSSDAPATLTADLRFSYTKDSAREVDLNGIRIHFVSDDSQKNNQPEEVKSSSEEAGLPQQAQEDPFQQEQERIQQILNQMQANQPMQQSHGDPQQAASSNQIPQDSSALKQQMQQQMAEQQEMKKEFQKQLASSQEVQQANDAMEAQGYNLTNINISPETNDTGSFTLDYERQDGSQANLKGNMSDGHITSLSNSTTEGRQRLIDLLKNNTEFQRYDRQLSQEGYKQQGAEFSIEDKGTSARVSYGRMNETASISADIVNDTVKNVRLEQEKKPDHHWWWIPILSVLLFALGYAIYRNRPRRTEKETQTEVTQLGFDYAKKALSMLEHAKRLYSKNEYKEAYGLCSQALRLYLSHDNSLNKEMTSDEIITYMRKAGKDYEAAKHCFDLCSLVEFAKYEANEKDFKAILNYGEKTIRHDR